LPFLYAFLTTPQGGLLWFVSRETLATVPVLFYTYKGIVGLVTVATFLLPVSLFWQLHRARGKNVPMISLVLQVTNGLWWLGTDYLNAWFWTAMFHSIQYLVVVVDRHIADQMARTDVKGPLHRPVVYGAAFYGISLVIAVVIFFIVPLGYIGLGFNAGQSFAMMIMVINLHHFIVDGFIWRNKPPVKKTEIPSRMENVPLAV
jgi:hypothetical protein